MAGINEVVSVGNNLNVSLNNLTKQIGNTFPRIGGSLTLNAGTSTVITQPSILAAGIVHVMPTNVAASTLIRTRGLYLSGVTAGTSFTLSTDNGTASGTETFNYIVVNLS